MITHDLMAPIEGCTHVQEGPTVIHRWKDENGIIQVGHRAELRGGQEVDGQFIAKYPASGRTTEWYEISSSQWTPARYADFIAFQAEVDADPEQAARPLVERAVAAILAYHQLLQVGERPVTEPEP